MVKIYGGGPTIIRDTLNIYGRDVSREVANNKKQDLFEFLPSGSNSGKDISKSMNIFAKKEGGSGDKGEKGDKSAKSDSTNKSQDQPGSKKKKRNLFLSENIWIEDEEGIPEEHSFSSLQQNLNIGGIGSMQQPS